MERGEGRGTVKSIITLVLLNLVAWCGLTMIVAQVKLPNEDPRTFVYVWSPTKAVPGATVYVERRQTDSDAPIRFSFPKTNDGGWTKRLIPDGDYTLFVDAEKYKSHVSQITVPTGKHYKFRDYTVWLELKE